MKHFLLFLTLIFTLELSHADRHFAFPSGAKWGFIDQSGQILLDARFDEVGTRAEKMWPVRSGKKWGFVSEVHPSLSIAPRFDDVAFFNEGLCFAKSGAKWGVIGKNGIWQIGPRYSFENSMIFPPHFSEGLAAVSISQSEVDKKRYAGEWGFIDRSGKWVLTPQFTSAEPFSEGMGEVSRFVGSGLQDGWMRRETSGKFTFVPAPRSEAMAFYEPFLEGLAAVETSKNGRRVVGFVDRNGQWAIEPTFSAILGFNFQNLNVGFRDGLALVVTGDTRENTVLGWIDKNGRWAIEPKFKGGGAAFSEGLSPVTVMKNDKQTGGFIDTTGQWAIAPQFEKMGVFQEGLAPVKRFEQKWEFIDSNGQTIIPPRFEYASMGEKGVPPGMYGLQFFDGLAFVKEDDTIGYIDKTGHLVWSTKTSGLKAAS